MLMLYKNIKERRLALGLSQLELAESTGYTSKTSISKIESGAIDLPQSKIKVFADALKVSPGELLGEQEISLERDAPPGFLPLPETVRVPLVGRIACGEPILAEENIEEYLDVPVGKRVDFCLECHGDSMIDIGLQDGDIAYIRKQPNVENGQIAAVRIGEEATLKRVYWDVDTLTLMPANSAYAPRVFTKEQINNVCIEGKMVGFTHWV